MILITIYGIIGIFIFAFNKQITRNIFSMINFWAEETDNSELRNRLMIKNSKSVFIIIISFGLFWLCLSVTLLLGVPPDSVSSVSLLTAGIVSLIFNRKIGALNSYWILQYRSMSNPLFWGRLNVILGGLILLIISFLSGL